MQNIQVSFQSVNSIFVLLKNKKNISRLLLILILVNKEVL